jgi:carboxymethylenebutenolidase
LSGKTIQIPCDSGSFNCYSRTSGKTGPEVVVLHPWWGLNDFIRSFCDRLAGEGFSTIAPDLYGGRLASTIPQAEELSSKLDGKEAFRKVNATLDYLVRDNQLLDGKVAVVGFSLGAFFALDLGATRPEVKGVVVFYGTSGTRQWDKSKASYLGHFAEKDPYEDPVYVQALEKSLKSAGKSVNFYTYPGTGHWFFESDRQDAYNPEAAALAWKRTLEFLHTTLR